MYVDTEDLLIPGGEVAIQGSLAFPEGAVGLVMFAPAGGRHDLEVAARLNARGLATLVLEPHIAEDERLGFDVDMLAERLVDAADFVGARGHTRGLPIGYFGSGIGAAVAVVAAARRPTRIVAVVACGGRMELAGPWLAAVRAPTLLIVGSADISNVSINLDAAEQLTVSHEIEVIPGATHRFDEPGALDEVGRLAGSWFRDHVAAFTVGHASHAASA